MNKSKGVLRILGGLGVAAGLCGLLIGPAEGQKFRRRPVEFGMAQFQANPPGDGQQFSAIKLVENSEFRQYINVAQECIKDKDWNDAVTALQSVLDNKEDFYVRIKEKDAVGRETVRWTSVKVEANNLLGSMPQKKTSSGWRRGYLGPNRLSS